MQWGMRQECVSYDRKKQVQSKHRKETGVCVYFLCDIQYKKRSREYKETTGETENDVKIRIQKEKKNPFRADYID